VSPPGRLVAAVLVSAAVHAALLGVLLVAGRPPGAATITSVRLVEVAVDGAAVASAEAPASPRRGKGSARPFAAEVARPEAPTPSPEADRGQGAPGEGLEAAAGSGTEVGGGAREGGGPGAAGGGADPRLAELHRRLAEAAARCYPPAAQRLRLRGEVPLRFCLDAQGGASGLSLLGTTGSTLLDRSALECVVPGAEPLPPLAGCFQVAVRFGG
jgi:periplasmic protein TonB